MTLKLDSILFPDEAAFGIQQSIEPLLARTLRRSMNGTLKIQSRWQKLRSAVSGSGWLPLGLDAIDLSVNHAMHCIKALSVSAAGNVITIPRAFRLDAPYAPQGAAVVNGEVLSTPVSLLGSVATLTPIVGASQYQVLYYPIITGAVVISSSVDVDNQVEAWTLEIEEA